MSIINPDRPTIHRYLNPSKDILNLEIKNGEPGSTDLGLNYKVVTAASTFHGINKTGEVDVSRNRSSKLNIDMLRVLLPFAFTICAISLFAQSDVIPTDDGDVTITPILHGTLVMEWKDRLIFIDPYGGADKFASFGKPELVLITHAHGDHLNKETLGGLDLSGAELIAPQSVVDDLGDIQFAKVTVMSNTGGASREGVHIEAVPMYNLPESPDAFHPKGWGNGYVISIGGKKFYISGDTEDIPEMRDLEGIDYAFVCMNLPYTMTEEQAADAVLEFKPIVVYPYHYRGKDMMSDIDKFEKLVSVNPEIEVRKRDWYPEK